MPVLSLDYKPGVREQIRDPDCGSRTFSTNYPGREWVASLRKTQPRLLQDGGHGSGRPRPPLGSFACSEWETKVLRDASSPKVISKGLKMRTENKRGTLRQHSYLLQKQSLVCPISQKLRPSGHLKNRFGKTVVCYSLYHLLPSS